MAFLFKTKTRSILTTTTLSLSTYAIYDKYQYKQILSTLSDKARIIANQPMKTTEIPRKVLVYLTPSQYAQHTFNTFIKPIFDAGALDYDVIDPKVDYTLSINEYIWSGKEEALERPVLLRERTWLEYFIGTKQLLPQSHSKYDPSVGVICIGNDVFELVVTGIEKGCYSNRPFKNTSIPSTSIDLPNSTTYEQGDENKTLAAQTIDQPVPHNTQNQETDIVCKDMQTSSMEPEEPFEQRIVLDKKYLPLPTPMGLEKLTYDTFDLFPIGFIETKNLIGFKYFFERVFMWFHERQLLERLGTQALRIVLNEEEESSVDPDENEKGLNCVDPLSVLPKELRDMIRVY